MGEIADALEAARAEIALEPEIFSDRCDVYNQTEAADEWLGDTNTQTAIATDVPCSYKALRFPVAHEIAGGKTITLTHEIKMFATAANHAIASDYELRVKVRGATPAFIFEHPIMQPDAMSVFLYFHATRRIT